MGNFRFSTRAETDLLEIARYTIEHFGLKQSQLYKQELFDCFNSLSNNSNLGRSASEYIPFLKQFPYKSHTIFYRPMETGILIVKVLNQNLDFERHL